MDVRGLNFNQLYCFHIIAKLGSLSKASSYLGLSVSTVSEHLRLLEEFIGQQLFARASRKLSINEVGLLAFRYTTKIFSESEHLVAKMRDCQQARLSQDHYRNCSNRRAACGDLLM